MKTTGIEMEVLELQSENQTKIRKEKGGQKTLVIMGSARGDSNTIKMVRESIEIDDYELIDLRNYNLAQYDYDHAGKPDDGFLVIAKKMIESDVIIFATPVYWYTMSGHMKVFFDRLTELLTSKKTMGRALKSKKVHLIACGGNRELPDGFEIPFRSTAKYFDMEFGQTLYQQMR